MDIPEVKAFNAELSGLYDNKPPISKAKMSAITRGAIKAIKFYKHVVHSVEKFILKCKPEYKVPGLYVIDSIVRQSRHQFGHDKDVFAPRFAKNMQQTFANLFRCPPEEKRNIIRVLNLWQKNNVFGSDVIQPLLDMANPNHPLHQEIQQLQQNATANGSTLNVSHNTTDSKISPMAANQHTPHMPSPPGEQFQDQPSGGSSGVKFNRKLLNDFEYDSEDDAANSIHEAPPSHHASSHSNQHPTHSNQHSTHSSQHPTHSTTHHNILTSHANTHQSHSNTHPPNTVPMPPQNPADALGSILTNPEIMRQLQSLQAQMQLMTGMPIPNLMPMMTDMQLQQNQNQNQQFLNSQQDQQKQIESKEDVANESDIEFVDSGPQVIEIPDANDSRSPSPTSRRHSSRSKSPKRRRRSRTRSRSPRRRRDRDRERDKDRDKEKEKDREKSQKEREAEKEKQREREKKGLPPIKKENLSVCSTTLWVGHLSKLATPEELSDLFGSVGGVVTIDVVAPRGCAFVVMERRRDAAKALAKLNKHKLHSKEITIAWAPGKGVKGREWKDYWEAELGVSYLPWSALHEQWVLGALSLDALEDGGAVDEDTLPPWLPPRIIPKTIMDNMPMMPGMPPPPGPPGLMPPLPGNIPNMPGLPNMPRIPGSLPNMPGNLSNMPGNLTNLPGNLPNIPGNLSNILRNLPNIPGNLSNLQLPGTPASISLSVPGIPPPTIPGGMPPGLAPGMPPGIRPPSIPTGVPGLQTEAGLPPRGPLLGFPPGMPPQPGMMGGFLGGLLGVGGVPLQLPPVQPHPQLPQHTPQRPTEVSHTDEAMDLDTEDMHGDESNMSDSKADTSTAPPFLPDQIQAMLSKPPPNFNASEPPPNFNMSEPPPFNSAQPPPNEENQKQNRSDEDKSKNERERDRRDRDRDRRDRDRDRRDRGDKGDRDRGDRDRRDRDRDRGKDRDRERDDRRDRDRDRGRDRRDRGERDKDRAPDRDRDRNRYPRDNNSERNRDKSPRHNNEPSEKSLQERLWEMANGKPATKNKEEKLRDDYQENHEAEVTMNEEKEEIPNQDMRHDRPPPPMMHSESENPPTEADGGWTQVAGPRQGPPPMGPVFRAELRMRPPMRPQIRGPWLESPFGPRMNGMGPPMNRPPFDRPPFEGGPLFEGPMRFERPPFNRMPFDGPNRPPFDGPPRFDGPRPHFDGPNRPPFDGPPPFDGSIRPPFNGPPPFGGPNRPPFEGPIRPHFDGPPPYDGPNRPPFDGPPPPFEGPRPPFDGPPRQFDGPPRFEGPPEFFDRNNRRFDDKDRSWNGDRDREWDRRGEWDDRRNRRPREHDDRYRDRNERRKFDENRGDRNDRNDKVERGGRGDRSDKGDRGDRPWPTKEDRNNRRDNKRSRWGDTEETTDNIDEKVLEQKDESVQGEAKNNEIQENVKANFDNKSSFNEQDNSCEQDNSHKEQGDAHKEQGDAYKEQGDAHKEQDDAHKEQGDAHKEQGDAHKDQGDAHKAQGDAHTEQGDAHNEKGDVTNSEHTGTKFEQNNTGHNTDINEKREMHEKNDIEASLVDTLINQKSKDLENLTEEMNQAYEQVNKSSAEVEDIMANFMGPDGTTDLYDANDAVDTSFIAKATEAESVAEKEKVPEIGTDTNTDDIFSEANVEEKQS